MSARQVPRNRTLWQAYKRQSIQEAVIRLICREGLKSVTMERVAREVGIAKGTVYLHYADKNELLEAVKESALTPMMARLDEVFFGQETPEGKLRACALRYLSYFEERRDLFRILRFEREVVRVQGSRYQSERYQHLVQQTARIIDRGKHDGTFREVDAHKVAAMFVDSAFALMNQRLLSQKPAPVQEDADLIGDLFIRGLKA